MGCADPSRRGVGAPHQCSRVNEKRSVGCCCHWPFLVDGSGPQFEPITGIPACTGVPGDPLPEVVMQYPVVPARSSVKTDPFLQKNLPKRGGGEKGGGEEEGEGVQAA